MICILILLVSASHNKNKQDKLFSTSENIPDNKFSNLIIPTYESNYLKQVEEIKINMNTTKQHKQVTNSGISVMEKHLIELDRKISVSFFLMLLIFIFVSIQGFLIIFLTIKIITV